MVLDAIEGINKCFPAEQIVILKLLKIVFLKLNHNKNTQVILNEKKIYRGEMLDVVYPIFLVNFFDCRRAPCPYCPAYSAHSHDPSFAIRILEHKKQDRTHTS